ncbi:MAG: molybdopterin-dependent oxidoreductase [Desulfobacterales bacterium]|nr:molybdopterin-dependent oxidoreductase [Desulfobacterales bacterium]
MKRTVKLAAIAGVIGAGLTLLALTPLLGHHITKGKAKRRRRLPAWNLNRWIRINSAGDVTVFVNKSDMGQGVFTSLPMIVAEELDADWTKISAAPSPSGEGYADPAWGMQLTGGSTSVMHMFDCGQASCLWGRTDLLRHGGCRADSGRAQGGPDRQRDCSYRPLDHGGLEGEEGAEGEMVPGFRSGTEHRNAEDPLPRMVGEGWKNGEANRKCGERSFRRGEED